MRPTQLIAAVTLALSATALPAVSTSAAGDPPTVSGREAAGDRALRHADAVLDGLGHGQDATLALRDLAQALPSLGPAERRQATAMLARPTDPHDQFGDSYRAPAKRACSPNICMHWVTRTSDAPPSRAWVSRTMDVMKQVWAREVGAMNYRRPLRDGHRGGDGRLDVYLKDVGAQGLFGYCATERRSQISKWKASGYCVLDDDFARSQFHAPPTVSLKATAAHEFFHEVQFALDFSEDAWWMEATATWMEEQVFDGANDNRRYIPFGQIGVPNTPLDEFQDVGSAQYGNWPFFEYLSSHFGAGVVRRIWDAAGEFPDGGKKYSTEAVVGVLSRHGGFTGVFSRYASANTAPARSYAEGSAWPKAVIDKRWKLSQDKLSGSTKLTVNHMASRNVVMKPDASLAGKRWRGRVVVDGPGLAKSPAVQVVVTRADGRQVEKTVRLNRSGVGQTSFGFSSGGVKHVTITAVNASTRFDCHQQTNLSCRGKPKDNGSTYQLKVAAFKS